MKEVVRACDVEAQTKFIKQTDKYTFNINRELCLCVQSALKNLSMQRKKN